MNQLKQKSLISVLLFLSLGSALLAGDSERFLKLYPSEILNTAGSFELEVSQSELESRIISFSGDYSLSDSSSNSQSLQLTLGLGKIRYQKQEANETFRTFIRSDWKLSGQGSYYESSSTDYYSAYSQITYSKYIGAERPLKGRLSIGGEAKAFTTGLKYSWQKKGSSTYDSYNAMIEFFDSYSLYLKVKL